MPELTHVDARGDARMVEVGEKDVTRREATAEGFVRLGPEALAAVVERTAKKGDVLAIAQLAAIQGAKRTSDLIPLCHPLMITGVDVGLTVEGDRVRCVATVRTEGRTGVEMEALTAVSAGLLAVYDMLKAVDRGMELGPIRLIAKSGGRSGEWRRG
ncbi:MAG: cyclic pyranopterin monophosphate synthase MoaC [Alphaproteobacteria bacterium]|nr:cyclic pyranopterin monophosphate synthase MoaC [Alphaproteobacteria bacterium]